MIRKTVHLPQALINSINDHAHHQETDFSKLVRETLKDKFGLLRLTTTLRKNGKTRS